jgi:hypothetical protein
MAHPSAPRFLALHGLRLKGFAEAEALAWVFGLEPDVVAKELDALGEEGLAVRREGRLSGWSLTPAGRALHSVDVAAELEASGARTMVEGAYRRFLEVNRDMLAVCTAWQLRERDGVQHVNDHTDEAYDADVIGRLVGIHDRVRPVTVELREALDRFRRYGERLRNALEKVVGGEPEWFTKPVIDSYHTVWFELHEDLLATLGIERASEGHA